MFLLVVRIRRRKGIIIKINKKLIEVFIKAILIRKLNCIVLISLQLCTTIRKLEQNVYEYYQPLRPLTHIAFYMEGKDVLVYFFNIEF